MQNESICGGIFFTINCEGKTNVPLHTGSISHSVWMHRSLSALPGYAEKQQIIYPPCLLSLYSHTYKNIF